MANSIVLAKDDMIKPIPPETTDVRSKIRNTVAISAGKGGINK